MRAALSDPRLLDIEEFLRIDFGPDLRAGRPTLGVLIPHAEVFARD